MQRDTVDDMLGNGLDHDTPSSPFGEPLGSLRNSEGSRKMMLYAGITAAVLIVGMVLFIGSCGRKENPEIKALQERVAALEDQGDRVADMEKHMAALEAQLEKLQQTMARFRYAARRGTVTGEGTVQSQRRSHVARPGENLSLIARKYGISVAELCRFNQITPKQVIRPGQKLWIEPAGN